MKYKVGDKVIVREWEDMEKEFGTDRDGDINAKCIFVKSMREHCGKSVTITGFTSEGNYWVKESMFIFSEDTFEKKHHQKIVITTDGAETLARLYDGDKVVKKAVAKCSPDDTFDFNVGAKLAFERLMNEQKKPLTFREKLKQEHPDYVGERWGGGCKSCPSSYGYEEKYHCGTGTYEEKKCTACWSRVIPEEKPKEKPLKFEIGKQYIGFNVKGDELVIKITRQDNKRSIIKYYYEIVRGKDYGSNCFQEDSEFAKRFKPYDPPKYYNGKVVCVKSAFTCFWTVGKVYEIKDGIVRADDGTRRDGITKENLKHIGDDRNEFIPLVE